MTECRTSRDLCDPEHGMANQDRPDAQRLAEPAVQLQASNAGHPDPPDPPDPDDDLPVVARLVVEIRSDGSRTVARGAIEDTALGQRVAVEARGGSPLALAVALARSFASVPRLSAKAAVRGLLGRKRDK
jgi:hypothetical protein